MVGMRMEISISHSKEYATAVAVMFKRSAEDGSK